MEKFKKILQLNNNKEFSLHNSNLNTIESQVLKAGWGWPMQQQLPLHQWVQLLYPLVHNKAMIWVLNNLKNHIHSL